MTSWECRDGDTVQRLGETVGWYDGAVWGWQSLGVHKQQNNYRRDKMFRSQRHESC